LRQHPVVQKQIVGINRRSWIPRPNDRFELNNCSVGREIPTSAQGYVKEHAEMGPSQVRDVLIVQNPLLADFFISPQ
jgi:hypothetical protein